MTANDWSHIIWPLWTLVLFTLLGTGLLYAKWHKRPTERKIYGLTPILERFIKNKDILWLTEPIVFIVVGSVVGLVACQPVNPLQALAAGLGWTAALSSK